MKTILSESGTVGVLMEGCSQDHGGITDRSDLYKNISENKDVCSQAL